MKPTICKTSLCWCVCVWASVHVCCAVAHALICVCVCVPAVAAMHEVLNLKRVCWWHLLSEVKTPIHSHKQSKRHFHVLLMTSPVTSAVYLPMLQNEKWIMPLSCRCYWVPATQCPRLNTLSWETNAFFDHLCGSYSDGDVNQTDRWWIAGSRRRSAEEAIWSCWSSPQSPNSSGSQTPARGSGMCCKHCTPLDAGAGSYSAWEGERTRNGHHRNNIS